MKHLILIVLILAFGCNQEEIQVQPTRRNIVTQLPEAQLNPDQKVLQEVNRRNSQLRSFQASHTFSIRQRRINIGSQGTTYYENGNIRIRSFAHVRNEQLSDIGSVGDRYWFFARRVNNRYMFVGSHSEIMSTNLRESVNPTWMQEALGLTPIDLMSEIQKDEGNLVIVEERISTRSHPVFKLTVIDPKKPAIIGHYLLSSSRRSLVSVVVKSFHTVGETHIPSEVEIHMPDEQVVITWRLQPPTNVNQEIDPQIWRRPSFRGIREVDLASGIRIPDIND